MLAALRSPLGTRPDVEEQDPEDVLRAEKWRPMARSEHPGPEGTLHPLSLPGTCWTPGVVSDVQCLLEARFSSEWTQKGSLRSTPSDATGRQHVGEVLRSTWGHRDQTRVCTQREGVSEPKRPQPGLPPPTRPSPGNTSL
ncbi:hypothetical protein CapIbe_011101 [Capra ibex]